MSMLSAAAAGSVGAFPESIAMPSFQVFADDHIVIDGVTYDSWEAVAAAGVIRGSSRRCGHEPRADAHAFDAQVFGTASPAGLRGSPADCTYTTTTIKSEYAPSNGVKRIPVVVHVIQRTNGTGFLTLAQVQSQIDILNEDFRALAGTNGALGTDTGIEFFLATTDPSGNPTNGVTYSTNNTWFDDNGNYWDTLAWDTSRYMNIYTNSAAGFLGYVPDLPQGGIAGASFDRVICLYSAFGRNSPFFPYHQGRTATHEVGHYFGLNHTFDYGCGSAAACYTSGDALCDTNRTSNPVFGCPANPTSCSGVPSPKENYMDYSDDLCMTRFTPEQANRMRCSITHFRPDLAVDASCPADLTGDGQADSGDLQVFITAFLADDAGIADLTGDGQVDSGDLAAFIAVFLVGC
jgi:hypothetical protein